MARQGSPYIWNEDSGDQKYFNERHHEKRNSPFGTNSETQVQYVKGQAMLTRFRQILLGQP